MKLIFLDFDGVINIPIWDAEGKSCRFYYPSDGKVNDFQAICWLNELCKRTEAKIVLTTSWRRLRKFDVLKEILYNSGLNKDIEIIGETPINNKTRSEQILEFLDTCDENVENFVILDDDPVEENLESHFVKCNYAYGFKQPEMFKALNILNDQ